MVGDYRVLFLGKKYKGDHVTSDNPLLNVLFVWREFLFSSYIFMKNKVKLAHAMSSHKVKHS